jgi:hypothetical protein
MAANPPASRASDIAAKRGEAVYLRPSSARSKQQVASDRTRPTGHSQVFEPSLTPDSASSEELHDESSAVTPSRVLRITTRVKTAPATSSATTYAPKRTLSISGFKRMRDARKRHPAPNRGKITVSARGSDMGTVQKQGGGLLVRIT